MALSFMKKLKKFEKGWSAAEGSQDVGFKNPPDGKHAAILFGAQIGESKNKENPRLQVTWDFRITKGKAINQHAFAYDSLEDDRGWMAIKGRLIALGHKPPKKIVNLPEALDNATETKCMIKLHTKRKGGFQNLTVLRRLKVDKEEMEPTAGLGEEEE